MKSAASIERVDYSVVSLFDLLQQQLITDGGEKVVERASSCMT